MKFIIELTPLLTALVMPPHALLTAPLMPFHTLLKIPLIPFSTLEMTPDTALMAPETILWMPFQTLERYSGYLPILQTSRR